MIDVFLLVAVDATESAPVCFQERLTFAMARLQHDCPNRSVREATGSPHKTARKTLKPLAHVLCAGLVSLLGRTPSNGFGLLRPSGRALRHNMNTVDRILSGPLVQVERFFRAFGARKKAESTEDDREPQRGAQKASVELHSDGLERVPSADEPRPFNVRSDLW